MLICFSPRRVELVRAVGRRFSLTIVLFMRTPAEKARRKRRRLALWGTDKTTKTNRGKGGLCDAIDVGEFLKPIRCFLRPENIVGGGFGRTATGAIPNAIQKHALATLAVTA